MDNLKVISGGDGYEDFSSSASNDLAGETSNNAITIIFEKHIAKNRANTLKQCHNNLFEKYISKNRANTLEQCHNNHVRKNISKTSQILLNNAITITFEKHISKKRANILRLTGREDSTNHLLLWTV